MVIPPYDIIIIIYLYAITVLLCRRQQKKILINNCALSPSRNSHSRQKRKELNPCSATYVFRSLGLVFFFLQTFWFRRDTRVTTGEYPHTVRRDDEQPRRWSGAETQRQQGQRGRRVQGERPVGG